MARPEVDWTFEDAPAEHEPRAPSPAPPPRQRRPGLRRPQQLWVWVLALSLLVAGVALALDLIRRQGEANIVAQLTAEVEYEDAQARAGNVDAAMRVWFTPAEPNNLDRLNTAWWRRRAAEAALHLAAPLPLPGLTPVDAPPRVISASPLPTGADQWDVIVARTYLDSAGNRLEFTLTQRYQNIGPGLWQRVPPDVTALAQQDTLWGQHLHVTLPAIELAGLQDSLSAVDAALGQACADWGADACGNEALPVLFTNDPRPGPPLLSPSLGPSAGVGPYPLALEVGALLPTYLQQGVTLFAPRLAGQPADAAGRAALTHALTVLGLTYLANTQAGPSNRVEDVFRDALVARAEQRLGLAGPVTYQRTAVDYLPIGRLWRLDELAPAPDQALAFRLQALQFLNGALVHEPAATDAALLSVLHRRAALAEWLDDVLGASRGHAAAAAWDAQAEALYAAAGNLAWSDLEGLSYSCSAGAYLVRQGRAELLPTGFMTLDLELGYSQQTMDISLDKRYVAYLEFVEGPSADLVVFDLDTGTGITVTSDLTLDIFGWSRGGGLVYQTRIVSDNPGLPTVFRYAVERYDPASGERRTVIGPSVDAVYEPRWMPDGRNILLLMNAGADWAPTIVPVDEPHAAPLPLNIPALGAVAAPDGERIAFTALGVAAAVDQIELLTLATGERQLVLSLATLRAADSTLAEASQLTPVAWSGDGAWLLVRVTESQGNNLGLYLVPTDDSQQARAIVTADGQPFVLVFDVRRSADGHYLSFRGGQVKTSLDASPLYLIDLASTGEAEPVVAQLVAAAVAATGWSPTQPQLAFITDGSVQVRDLSTGLTRWVADDNCQSLIWYGR